MSRWPKVRHNGNEVAQIEQAQRMSPMTGRAAASNSYCQRQQWAEISGRDRPTILHAIWRVGQFPFPRNFLSLVFNSYAVQAQTSLLSGQLPKAIVASS